MEPRLQRRIQRLGWDLAAPEYEPLWQRQLALAHDGLLAAVAPAAGERVLDVACGSGLVTLRAARAVGPRGRVVGVDLSPAMVEAARRRARDQGMSNATLACMDAETLALADRGFDIALCAFGLMYLPEPRRAIDEMKRLLRPGGRIGLAVWGERAACGWASVWPIVDAEVTTAACPLFFGLGHPGALRTLCAEAGLTAVIERRLTATLAYADDDEAAAAAFLGGPVALAWSRFDDATRARVRANYIASLQPWRHEQGYRVPGEFVLVTAVNGDKIIHPTQGETPCPAM